jgi:hypothetical protein
VLGRSHREFRSNHRDAGEGGKQPPGLAKVAVPAEPLQHLGENQVANDDLALTEQAV